MKFGDIVENEWASKDNPRRIGIFVRHCKRDIEVTDGKGTFWHTMKDKDSKTFVIGSVLKETNNEQV